VTELPRFYGRAIVLYFCFQKHYMLWAFVSSAVCTCSITCCGTCTYRHPDGEADEGEDGQLEDEVDVDHDRYGWYEGQSWGHEEQSLPASEAKKDRKKERKTQRRKKEREQ